mmetsp:Transcript_25122/g.68121  ORF Transcript_25122/g.68121 Transcript_25122/m.68121 type:complete len:255 (-) Transcript_25122:211-975(-)
MPFATFPPSSRASARTWFAWHASATGHCRPCTQRTCWPCITPTATECSPKSSGTRTTRPTTASPTSRWCPFPSGRRATFCSATRGACARTASSTWTAPYTACALSRGTRWSLAGPQGTSITACSGSICTRALPIWPLCWARLASTSPSGMPPASTRLPTRASLPPSRRVQRGVRPTSGGVAPHQPPTVALTVANAMHHEQQRPHSPGAAEMTAVHQRSRRCETRVTHRGRSLLTRHRRAAGVDGSCMSESGRAQ